jgi:hypothetical protein
VNAEVLRADDPVVLPHLGSIGRLWSAVLEVADHRSQGWTLIGALMVMLHEHEAGTPTRPATADADAVVDARGATDATRAMAALVVKSCAAAGDQVRGPQRHLEDLARLYRLVTDPAAWTTTAKDRKRLRDAAEPIWDVLDDPSERAAARAARRLLATPPS